MLLLHQYLIFRAVRKKLAFLEVGLLDAYVPGVFRLPGSRWRFFTFNLDFLEENVRCVYLINK